MLTGRAAFAGDTLSDTIAAILGREPDWSRPARGDARTHPAAAASLPRQGRQAPPARHRRRAHGNRRCVERRHHAGSGDVGHRACVDIRCPDGRRARQAKPWPPRSRDGFRARGHRRCPLPAAPGGAREGSTKLDRSSGRLFVCAAHGGRGACTVARRNQDRVRGTRPRGKVVVGPVAGRVRREIADGYGRRGGPVLVTGQRRARVRGGWKPQDGETRWWRSTGARHWSPVHFAGRASRRLEWRRDDTLPTSRVKPERVKPTC